MWFSLGYMLIEGLVGWLIGFFGFFNLLLSLVENIEYIVILKWVLLLELVSVILWMCGSDSLFDMIFGILFLSDCVIVVYVVSLVVYNDYIIVDEKIVLSDVVVVEKLNFLLSK